MDICLYADVSSSLCRRQHLCLCASRTTSMLKKISDCHVVPDFSNIFLNFSQLFYFDGHCSCDICYRYVRLPRIKSQEERVFISRMPGKNRHPASFHCVIHNMTVYWFLRRSPVQSSDYQFGCSHEHGKVCFLLNETQFAAENPCHAHGSFI